MSEGKNDIKPPSRQPRPSYGKPASSTERKPGSREHSRQPHNTSANEPNGEEPRRRPTQKFGSAYRSENSLERKPKAETDQLYGKSEPQTVPRTQHSFGEREPFAVYQVKAQRGSDAIIAVFQSNQMGPACIQGYSLRSGAPRLERQLNLDNQINGTFWIFSSCVDSKNNRLFLATNRGVVETDYVALIDESLCKNCSSKIFSTTDICKCVATSNGTVAFAVHDLDNGSRLSSNTLVVMRTRDSEKIENQADARPSTPKYNTMQLQMDGRITGISISDDAKTLTVVSQEETTLDLGQLVGLTELKEAQTVKPVLSLVVKEIGVQDDDTLKI